jgi:hypothetical protein
VHPEVSNQDLVGGACGFTKVSVPVASFGKTLMLHWNGSCWTRVASPDPGGATGSLLFAASAAGPDTAWAVGSVSQAG